MPQTFSCLFYPKKPKKYVSGSIPVYMRITVPGHKPAEHSIGREVDPGKWVSKPGRMKGTTDEVKKFNNHLDTLKAALQDAETDLIREKRPVTPTLLKNKFLGIDGRQRMLKPIFQKHNDEMKALVPKEFAQGTHDRYETTLSHTFEYLKSQYQLSDIDIRDIDHAFVTGFDFFLRTKHNCGNNTTVKYLFNFKKIIGICLANGWLDKDPFANYNGKIEDIEKAFLWEDELKVLENKKFSMPRLQLVKDIFVFCCYTGLAYADVKDLNNEKVSIGIDGGKWLFVKRKKTGKLSPIPLLPVALEILDKYKDHPQCLNTDRLLPVLSNQKMNAYLKEIADICEISVELTCHVARHTFATTVTLSNDVPMETVSEMMGHATLPMTQKYGKIVKKKIARDMQQLRTRLASQMTVVKDEATGS